MTPLSSTAEPQIKFRPFSTIVMSALALLYGAVVATFVFELRLQNPSSDIWTYIRMHDRLSELLEFDTIDPIRALSNELLFHWLFQTITGFTGDPLTTLRIISFFAGTACFYVVSAHGRAHFFLTVLVFTHPLTLDLFSSQQRMALALACILLLCTILKKGAGFALSILVGGIHTFGAAIGIIGLWGHWLAQRKNSFSLVVILASAAIVAVAISFGRDIFLGALNDRRVGTQADLLGFSNILMWTLTFGAMMALHTRGLGTSWGLLFATCACTAVLSNIAGVYSARFIPLALVFFGMSFSNADIKWNRVVLLTLGLLVNCGISFSYWIRFSI